MLMLLLNAATVAIGWRQARRASLGAVDDTMVLPNNDTRNCSTDAINGVRWTGRESSCDVWHLDVGIEDVTGMLLRFDASRAS